MTRRDTGTGIGGPNGRFPTTKWSAIAALSRGEPEERKIAQEAVVTAYWKPAYKYLRIRWRKSNEDAKDLTQSFFARVIEKDFFHGYDPVRSRFRTFFRTCLDGFAANEEKAARAGKRGGNAPHLPLDYHQAEVELQQQQPSAEDCFEKEWVRNFFSVTLEEFSRRCRENGKETHFQLFQQYDIDPDAAQRPSYAELASRFAIPVTSVTNYLAYARREFRKLLLQKLREITGSEAEFRTEARRLLGSAI